MSTTNYTPADKNFVNDILSFSSKPHNQSPVILSVLVFFFFVVFLATLLYLHYHRNHINSTTVDVPVAVPTIAIGLKADAIDSIPIFLHESMIDNMGKYEKEECTICLGMFEDGEKVKVLPVCLHAYHSDCVDEWLKNKSNCPLCRSSLDSNSTTCATDDESAIV